MANRKPVKTSDGLTVYCGFTKLADPRKLKAHPQNTRTHPQGQLTLLGEIIEGNGWRETITVSRRSGQVTRGHARLQIALDKGWREVPVDLQHYDSAEAELADLIADTRIKEFSNLDDARLRAIVVKMQEQGANLRLTALDANVIDTILREYQNSLHVGMITPETGGQDGNIRQVILVFDDGQHERFATAIGKLEGKRPFASLSELCLDLLRDANSHAGQETD